MSQMQLAWLIAWTAPIWLPTGIIGIIAVGAAIVFAGRKIYERLTR